jgi:sarcosine oxidase gamma subunit
VPVTATSSSSAVAATVPLDEVGTTLNVTVTQGGAALTGGTVATVTLTSLDGATAPAPKSTGTGANLGKVSFTGLPPGQWQVQAAIGTKTSPQQTVTIATATATAQTTTVDVAP